MVTPQIDWYFEPPARTRPLDCARCCISATKNGRIRSRCGVRHRSVNQTVASLGVYLDFCLDLNIRNTALLAATCCAAAARTSGARLSEVLVV
jgi:hypothetical protein